MPCFEVISSVVDWPVSLWESLRAVSKVDSSARVLASPSKVYPAGKLQWHFTGGSDFRHGLWLPFLAAFAVPKSITYLSHKSNYCTCLEGFYLSWLNCLPCLPSHLRVSSIIDMRFTHLRVLPIINMLLTWLYPHQFKRLTYLFLVLGCVASAER